MFGCLFREFWFQKLAQLYFSEGTSSRKTNFLQRHICFGQDVVFLCFFSYLPFGVGLKSETFRRHLGQHSTIKEYGSRNMVLGSCHEMNGYALSTSLFA